MRWWRFFRFLFAFFSTTFSKASSPPFPIPRFHWPTTEPLICDATPDDKRRVPGRRRCVYVHAYGLSHSVYDDDREPPRNELVFHGRVLGATGLHATGTVTVQHTYHTNPSHQHEHVVFVVPKHGHDGILTRHARYRRTSSFDDQTINLITVWIRLISYFLFMLSTT